MPADDIRITKASTVSVGLALVLVAALVGWVQYDTRWKTNVERDLDAIRQDVSELMAYSKFQQKAQTAANYSLVTELPPATGAGGLGLLHGPVVVEHE